MIAEGQFYTGGLKSKLDLRDHVLGQASVPFDWSRGYDVDEAAKAAADSGFSVVIKDQGSSFSCGGQAGSYLEAVLGIFSSGNYEERSARDIYSVIAYPEGGTTLRDILNYIVKTGVASEKFVPSYNNGMAPSEAFMRQPASDPRAADSRAGGKALGYAFTPADIDAVAAAVRDNHGQILLVYGEDNGSWRTSLPVAGKRVWAHFLHARKAKMVNGKRCIGCFNSWGPSIGDNGLQWISEDYFAAGNVIEVGGLYQDASVLEKKIALTKTLLGLLQKLLIFFTGPTKIAVNN